MGLIEIVVFLILVGLVFWATNTLAGAFDIPAPIITVIQVLLVIFAVLALLQAGGVWGGGPVLRLR